MTAAWQPVRDRVREPAPFEPVPPTSRPAPLASQSAMALVVPDFDAPPLAPAPEPAPAPDPAEAIELMLQARLEAAREAGFAAGEATARETAAAGLAAREAAALERIAAALAEGREQAAEAAGEAAEALARLLLAALDAALPEAAARLAPEAAVRLAAELRPLLEEGVAVTLRVPPGCAAALAARLGDPVPAIIEDPALPPGDAAAVWRGGGAALSLSVRRRAVAALLNAFELGER